MIVILQLRIFLFYNYAHFYFTLHFVLSIIIAAEIERSSSLVNEGA